MRRKWSTKRFIDVMSPHSSLPSAIITNEGWWPYSLIMSIPSLCRNVIRSVLSLLKSPQNGSSGCRYIPSMSAARKAASGGHHEWNLMWLMPYPLHTCM